MRQRSTYYAEFNTELLNKKAQSHCKIPATATKPPQPLQNRHSRSKTVATTQKLPQQFKNRRSLETNQKPKLPLKQKTGRHISYAIPYFTVSHFTLFGLPCRRLNPYGAFPHHVLSPKQPGYCTDKTEPPADVRRFCRILQRLLISFYTPCSSLSRYPGAFLISNLLLNISYSASGSLSLSCSSTLVL